MRGTPRAVAAFLFGLLSALAFPPYTLTPVLWISFPALIFILRGTTTGRQAFLVGWCFAFGFFLLGLYWIAAAMFVDIAQFWWAVPLAVAGLPFFFALYYGLAAAIARKMGLEGLSGITGFALIWFLGDYARGHLLTGFPWILVGHAWSAILPIQQTVSVIGIYGLSLITTICVCLPAVLISSDRRQRWFFLASLVVLLSAGVWGVWRLDSDPHTVVEGVRLRLVQPNIGQAHKWNEAERESHFGDLLNLMSAPGDKPVTQIIWPETAATFYLMEDSEHRHAIAAHLPPDGSLLTGVIRRTRNPQGHLNYYNSLIAVDSKARVLAGYDKFHLVPFGEYIPLRNIMPFRTLANLGLDFATGDGLRSLRVTGLPSFSPLICYEAIFPGEVIDPEDRPRLMINITNDGWYGHTAGPYQHFAIVRLRAIEEGLPLVRVANTGISGVIDAYGHITTRLGVGRTGFLDADLPEQIGPTPFSQYGERILWAIFGLFLVCFITARVGSLYGLMKMVHRR